MSKEWNQVMVDLIRQTEYSWPSLREWYRGTTSNEVLEPDEFQWNSGVQEEPAKSEIYLAAMREKYEQTKAVQGLYNKSCILQQQKEKWKETSPMFSEEDFP